MFPLSLVEVRRSPFVDLDLLARIEMVTGKPHAPLLFDFLLFKVCMFNRFLVAWANGTTVLGFVLFTMFARFLDTLKVAGPSIMSPEKVLLPVNSRILVFYVLLPVRTSFGAKFERLLSQLVRAEFVDVVVFVLLKQSVFVLIRSSSNVESVR